MASEINRTISSSDTQGTFTVDVAFPELEKLSTKTKEIASRYLDLCAKYHQYACGAEISDDFVRQVEEFSQDYDSILESSAESRNAFRDVITKEKVEKYVGSTRTLKRKRDSVEESPRAAKKPQISNHGLPNLGNTCFANSAIQCLFNTHGIDTLLNQELPVGTAPEKIVFQQNLRNLRAEYRNEHPDPIRMRALLEILWASPLLTAKFAMRREQADASEFLAAVLDILEIEKQPNLNVTQGSIRFDRKTRETVEGVITRENVVHLPMAESLQGCVDQYLQPEELNKENIPNKNSNCTFKQLFFQGRLPEVIQLCLKRFKGNRKIQDSIAIDGSGTFTVPVIHEGKTSPVPYQIDAVICHEERTHHGGHYFTLVKTQDGWTKFDDGAAERHLSPAAGLEIVKAKGYHITAHQIKT